MLFPEKMKLKDAIRFTAPFYPSFDADYAYQLANKFQLNPNKPISALSTGYSTIYKLIVALSTNAPYLLLDEPVLGLDANHRDLLYRTLLQKYGEKPCTIVLSTHLVEEISKIIEQVIILKDGGVLYEEPSEELLSRGYAVSGMAKAVDAYIEGKSVIGSESLGGLKTAYLLGTATDVPETVEVSRMDLQKLFIQLTNDNGGSRK